MKKCPGKRVCGLSGEKNLTKCFEKGVELHNQVFEEVRLCLQSGKVLIW